MDSGLLGSLITIGSTVVLASTGGTIKWARDRGKTLRSEAAKREDSLVQKVDRLEQAQKLLEQTLDAKDDVISDLTRQRDKLEITAELQERFFGQLPPKRRNSGD